MIVHYPVNYGFNMGEWLVYDPAIGQAGQGTFIVNGGLTSGSITDGLSNTVMAAEVKMFTPQLRNGTAGPNPPSDPSQICGYGGQLRAGSDVQQNPGHTEWVDGKVHETGFSD